ncbi:MAG: VTT domain-containing protein [Tepidisphaeraceae bacterium]
MDLLHKLIYLLWGHLGDDEAWRSLLNAVGLHQLYAVLFLIVFIETGLVVFPFLPGDSLLFAVGTMTARDIGLSLPVVIGVLFVAAIAGDNCNYWLGRRLGPKVFASENSRLLNKKHLLKAQAFYENYGGKTIILARFVPIIRTFAPFVAGVGKMNYGRFLLYSIGGGAAWVCLCVLAGWQLGSLPFFKKHFEVVVLIIVLISLVPMAVEFIRVKFMKQSHGDGLLNATTLSDHLDRPES